MSIFGSFAYLNFEVFKRRANRIVYKHENESIFRLIEYFLLFVVLFFTISVPTFLIAAFSSLFGNQEYVVADKKNVVKKNIQEGWFDCWFMNGINYYSLKLFLIMFGMHKQNSPLGSNFAEPVFQNHRYIKNL